MEERKEITNADEFMALFLGLPVEQRGAAVIEAIRGLSRMVERVKAGDDDVRMTLELGGPDGPRAQQR